MNVAVNKKSTSSTTLTWHEEKLNYEIFVKEWKRCQKIALRLFEHHQEQDAVRNGIIRT